MRRTLPALSLIVLAAVVVYGMTLGQGFVADDWTVIAENRLLGDWSKILGNLGGDFFQHADYSVSIGYWRPVVTLSYMVDQTLFSGGAWGFHLRNVLLHSIVSCLVFLLAARLPAGRGVALGSGLLFAVHPAHVESVAWISGRTDIYCALFMLLALLLDVEHARAPRAIKRVGSLLATALALLSKEMAAVLPGLVFLRVWLLPRDREREAGVLRSAVRGMLLHAAMVIAYLVVRFGVLSVSIESQDITPGQRWILFLTWWNGFLEYVRVLVWPAGLAIARHVPLETSPLSPRVVAGAALMAAAVLLLWRTRRSAPTLAFCLGVLLVSFVPVSNFILPRDFTFRWYERFLYVPSVGFCIAASWVLLRGVPAWLARGGAAAGRARPPGWAIAVFAVITLALGGRAIARVTDWNDEVTLFAQAVRHSPDSKRARVCYATALVSAGRLDDAEEQLRQILRIDPGSCTARYNLGNVHRERGDLDAAESEFRAALAIRPLHARSHLNLGLTLCETGRVEEGYRHLELADRLLPHHVGAKTNLANALRLLGRTDDAIPVYRQALAMDPGNAPARLGLAGAYLESGFEEEGREILGALLEAEPDMVEAHLLLAIHLDRTGRSDEAEARFREVLRLDPGNAKVRRRLGLAPPQ